MTDLFKSNLIIILGKNLQSFLPCWRDKVSKVTTGLTVQLPLNEVHPVRDLVLDCIYVIQQVDLPLLMLPAVIRNLSRISSTFFPGLSLGPRATHRSLETFRRNHQTGCSLQSRFRPHSTKAFWQINAHYSCTQEVKNQKGVVASWLVVK